MDAIFISHFGSCPKLKVILSKHDFHRISLVKFIEKKDGIGKNPATELFPIYNKYITMNTLRFFFP